jgi:hypothetical protein
VRRRKEDSEWGGDFVSAKRAEVAKFCKIPLLHRRKNKERLD